MRNLTPRTRPPRSPRFLLLAAPFLLATTSCDRPTEASSVLADAIARHGGDRFETIEITFTFRDAEFRVLRFDERFRYERSYVDPAGRSVLEAMHNDGVELRVDGEQFLVTSGERGRIETAVNSVVYFAFLPHRLSDPAVQPRLLDADTIGGEPYHTVEVTFLEAGGGEDWEDRFVYWIHERENTLDYMAYRYYRDGGGTRFRVAVNRREVGGLLVQDYENFAADHSIDDIATYPRMHEEGRTRLVSMVELRDVRVHPLTEPF